MEHPPFLKSLLLTTALILVLALPTSAGAQSPGQAPDLSSLEAVSTRAVTVTWDARTGGPAFITGRFPSGTTASRVGADPLGAAQHFLADHQAAFNMTSPEHEWTLVRADVDGIGMTHVRLQQMYRGVPVLGAELLVHFGPSGRWITAINGDYLSDVKLQTLSLGIRPNDALRIARAALPDGLVQHGPRLVVADGRLNPGLNSSHLAWLIELYDHSAPARNVYLLDARTGFILEGYNRLTLERDRWTYTAENKQVLPGTLWLTEAGPVEGQSPDDDGLNAHQFAGDTYDYFSNAHGRDSYDNRGAALVASVHYGNNYQNAFWNGSQMVYGDGFAGADDVVAHELTHAVTEYTANLVYRFQSGALNESFSDIFGAMVDNGDWLMGEDLPIGAIRSLADPRAFGDPDHLDLYVNTCEDNGGVHTNSGIPNKAAYLLSEALERYTAGRIFYRTLTYYLTSSSGFNDARASAIQAAQDLFGTDSDEVKGTMTAFSTVGLDGVSEPPAPSCDCAASLTLNDRSLFDDIGWAVRAMTTLYRTRDELMSQTPAGRRYIDLYYAHTGEISRLLAKDQALRDQAADVLRSVLPGLTALLDGQGDRVVVTPGVVAHLNLFLRELVAADRDGALAKAIAAERSRLKLDSLAGLTFEEAWRTINTSQQVRTSRVH